MDSSSKDSLDSAFKSASFSDKMWLFISRNTHVFVRLGIAIICIIFLISIFLIWQKKNITAEI